ncbi:hypothetical protein DH2020_012356 [Rehmannia glutinosa]|uniref:Transmembrane protein n=1 Tax=Rehmannia glutinosa TaxID=99300 RepID=A0ABR0WZ56_REHGL
MDSSPSRWNQGGTKMRRRAAPLNFIKFNYELLNDCFVAHICLKIIAMELLCYYFKRGKNKFLYVRWYIYAVRYVLSRPDDRSSQKTEALLHVLPPRCPINEAQNELEFDACKSYRGIFDANSQDVLLDGHVSPELVSTHSVKRHSLENICPHSNSFCFPSTLTGFLLNGVDAETEATDDPSGARSEDFSSKSTQVERNLSWSSEHGIFRLFDGRVISCSSFRLDNIHEFPSTNINTKNGHETHSSKSGENAETVESGFSDGFSTPPVEIKPFLLDWGQKNVYCPSLAFLTVKNVDTDSVLSIYGPYSSNSQFYPCNFSDILLAPGEIASICFVFYPTKLGLSSAQLLLQTSFGGFLIGAKGFAIESPYLIKPLIGLDVSSSGRSRKNLSLFNPFNVVEIVAWISISSGNESHSSKAICTIHSLEDSTEYSMLSAKEWLDFESAEGFLPQIAIRPHKNWEVGPLETETIIELDISDHLEGKIVGAFCFQLVRSSGNEIETVMVPLEAELSPNSASDTALVSVSLEALVPCDNSGSVVVSLSVRNDALSVLSVIKIRQVGESAENFQVKSIEGLLLFPRSVTQVAIISYAHPDTFAVTMNCKLLVEINDTRSSLIEIPCVDVISVYSGRKLDSTVGYAQVINNVDYIRGREKSFSSSMQSPSEIKAVDTREADELVLKNWKSQATSNFMSVLEDNEVLFSTVHVGNHCSQWISIKNPSQEPIAVQLILNSGQVIDKCRKTEMHLQPSSSSILAGNKSIAPYGFSIAKDALTEALILPYGSAIFGPILFRPSNSCEWRSSALIRNNLSGVEWLSLRGFGGSFSLVLLEGSNPVQSVEFKLNSPSLLNFSSREILYSMDGKSPFCPHHLIKEVHAKNTGDFPLEVVRVEVSGSECGLDGFLVRNCKGFSLPPGESIMLQISYQSDFSAATIQRDLELALTTGIIVIPMKASLPIYLLNFCKRSIFWMRLKKATAVILFAASLLFLLFCFLFPRVTLYDFESEKNSSTAVNSLSMHLNGKNSGAPEQEHVNSSGNQKQKNSLMDNLLSNSDAQDGTDSRNLRVSIIGKEKGRKRRKKKNSCTGVPKLFDFSSSQSSNSTPSSPLSPASSITLSPDIEISSAAKSSSSDTSSKAGFVDNKVSCLSAQEKSIITRKFAGKAVLLPSATFPSACRTTPYSPCLASTSRIAPHARAPGTKLHNQENGDLGEKLGFEEKFTYDIWGDHLFGLNLSCHSKQGTNLSIENNSESFFVRDPQTLMANSQLKYASPQLEGTRGNKWGSRVCAVPKCLSLNFSKRPAGNTVQQFDKSEETQLSIGVSYPVVENGVNRNRRAQAEFKIPMYYPLEMAKRNNIQNLYHHALRIIFCIFPTPITKS